MPGYEESQLLDIIRREAARILNTKVFTRGGTIVNYDPTRFMVQVALQPEDITTGWLNLCTLGAGEGWGLFAPPINGTPVTVIFIDGSIQAGVVLLPYISTLYKMNAIVAQGEFWLVHKSGTIISATNDGNATISAKGQILLEVLQGTGGIVLNCPNGMVNITAQNVNVTGDLVVSGNILSGGSVSDVTGTMAADRVIFDSHTHPGVTTGPGSTLAPTQQE